METRNILDYQGNVIGQLSLPSGTSESIWSAALAPYAMPPLAPLDIVTDKLAYYQALAPATIRQMLATNTLAGITPAQSYQAMKDYGLILQMVRFGMFPTAIYALQNSAPSGFITQPMLDSWIAMLQGML
jgi:hypothetical protein